MEGGHLEPDTSCWRHSLQNKIWSLKNCDLHDSRHCSTENVDKSKEMQQTPKRPSQSWAWAEAADSTVPVLGVTRGQGPCSQLTPLSSSSAGLQAAGAQLPQGFCCMTEWLLQLGAIPPSQRCVHFAGKLPFPLRLALVHKIKQKKTQPITQLYN